MFVDVRGFTSLSERMSPLDLADMMSEFYRSSTRTVVNLDGTVNKFVGDQIMAFFGVPYRPDHHAQRAVEAAVEIVATVEALSKDLRVGGGVATGLAYVGNVGGGEVTDFTALSDAVNVAARLQGEAAPGEILIEKITFDRVKWSYQSAFERRLQLKGKSEPTSAWVLNTNS